MRLQRIQERGRGFWLGCRTPPSLWLDRSHWGSAVTIGIAARSGTDDCIVTVSDRRISFDDAVPSLDAAIQKDWFVGRNWGTLFAANDTCFAKPIIRLANELLTRRGDKEGIDDIRAAMCDAYAAIRRKHVTREYLSKFGFESIEQFREAGPQKLGRKLFWSLSRKIDNDSLEQTTFLVSGYDPTTRNTAHLFEVKNPGNWFDLDHMQYWAIGSGANIAMASLNMRPVSHLDAKQLIYRALEAKFAAEDSSAVGKSTLVLIANRGEPTGFLSTPTVNKIRELWERERWKAPPDEIDKLIATVRFPIL